MRFTYILLRAWPINCTRDRAALQVYHESRLLHAIHIRMKSKRKNKVSVRQLNATEVVDRCADARAQLVTMHD